MDGFRSVLEGGIRGEYIFPQNCILSDEVQDATHVGEILDLGPGLFIHGENISPIFPSGDLSQSAQNR